jgi:WD40 repeat protein
MDEGSAEEWLLADEEVRKSLPPGVKLIRTLRGHKDIIGRIAWSPDGRMLATPSRDKTIRLWDAETGKLLDKLEGHEGGVNSVAFDPKGLMLASGSNDGTAKLWDIAGGKQLLTLSGGDYTSNSVWSVAIDTSPVY